jgi:hypothetical protein
MALRFLSFVSQSTQGNDPAVSGAQPKLFARELSHAHQVEILIRGHFCFVLACSMNGVEIVLKLAHSKIPVSSVKRNVYCEGIRRRG